MSTREQVLKNMIGTPIVYLYTANGEPLRYIDGGLLMEYVEKFKYTYSEDVDELCEIVLKFDRLSAFDLPYIRQDVVIQVQWGYILENGNPLLSPIRKIAIRDIKNKYSVKGIEVTLVCTDIVAYIKSLKVQIKKTYTDNNYQEKIKSLEEYSNAFKEYLHDFSNNSGMTVSTVESSGIIEVAKNGKKIKEIRDGVGESEERPRRNYMFGDNPLMEQHIQAKLEEHQDKQLIREEEKKVEEYIGQQIDSYTINLSTSQSRLTKAFLKLFDVMAGGGLGNKFMDTIDDQVIIMQRNFKKPTFRTYVFKGNKGELLEFNSNTATNRVQVDGAKSSTVNPHNKTIETAETYIYDNNETPAATNNDQVINKQKVVTSGDITDPLLEFVASWHETRKGDNVKNVGEIDINKEKFIEIEREVAVDALRIKQPQEVDTRPKWERVNNSKHEGEEYGINYWKLVTTHNAKYPENPITQQEAKEMATPRTKEYAKAVGIDKTNKAGVQRYLNAPYYNNYFITESRVGRVLKNMILDKGAETINNILTNNRLINEVTEKMVRKYEADAQVVGDPSVIKSQIYQFLNLGPENSGRWYATEVTHELSLSMGYLTKLKLIRVPKDVRYTNIKYSTNPKVGEDNKIILEESMKVVEGQFESENNGIATGAVTGSIDHVENRLDRLNSLDKKIREA